MATVKKLVGDAALYGVSSIVARLLNFLLTPLHTAVLPKAEYGAYSDLYVFIAFLMVVLTYGMETAYFRFSQRADANSESVYSTSLLSILGTTVFFLLVLSLFYKPLAEVLRYGSRPELVLGVHGRLLWCGVAGREFASRAVKGAHPAQVGVSGSGAEGWWYTAVQTSLRRRWNSADSRSASVRGCGRSTGTMRWIRPGRAAITTTRWAR